MNFNDTEQGFRQQLSTLTEQFLESQIHFRQVTIPWDDVTTAHTIIPDDDVPTGYTPRLLGYIIQVGATGLSSPMTALDLKTSQTGTVYISFPRSGVLSPNNNVVHPGSESAVVENAPFTLGQGAESGEGLVLQGDQLPGSGSDLVISVWFALKRV